MAETGEGATIDVAQAQELYRRACAAGSRWSCEQSKRLGD
jgi:TPR repeat protein